jgi:thymidylate synthase
MNITINGMSDFREILSFVKAGVEVSPRGITTVDQSPLFITILNPRNRLVPIIARKANYAFAFTEWLMIMTGDDSVERLAAYSKEIRKFSSDGVTITGAYGPRVFPQLSHVEEKLRSDRNTRQAVISILKAGDTLNADPPCTISVQLRINGGKLDVITTMRSNDIMWGFTYDVFYWTMLQEWFARRLGLAVGTYYHNVGSMHLYTKRDGAMVAAIESEPYEATCPMRQMDQFAADGLLQKLSTIETNLRTLGPIAAWDDINALPPYWRDWGLVLFLWHARKKRELVPWCSDVARRLFFDATLRDNYLLNWIPK